MNKQLIIINGVMGVGKTSVCKNLYKCLDGSFWLDGDNCWMMNPFIIDDENRTMVLDNIGFMINSFIKNSKSKYVIFNWVIQNDNIMKDVLSRVNIQNVDVYKITLMCSQEELIQRIKSDVNIGLRDEDNVQRSMDRYGMYATMDTIKVDTTGKEVLETVNEIIKILR